MSCLNSTGPVDIVHSDNIIYCKETCKLSYNFKSTQIAIANKGDCLIMEPTDKSSTPVTYSSTNAGDCENGGEGKYAVQEVRIYCATDPGGSLHKYEGIRATGEVIIYLNNIAGSGHLIICIPISSTTGTLPKATAELSSIINNSLSVINSTNETMGPKIGVELDLNNFIPKNEGFYSYTATLPYSPCTNCINYVVYSLPNAIFLPNSIVSQLTDIITRLATPIHSSTQSNIGYSYNKTGAVHTSIISGETYMDCQPVGEDGEVLISENKNGPSSLISGLSPEAQAQFKNGVLIFSIIILSIGALCLILFGIPKIMTSMGWTTSTESVSKMTSNVKSKLTNLKLPNIKMRK